MASFSITIADADVQLLQDLATTEGTDVAGLIAGRSTALVQFRKDAIAKAVLSSRIAKQLHAGPVLLQTLDSVALPGGTTVQTELAKALKILGVRQ